MIFCFFEQFLTWYCKKFLLVALVDFEKDFDRYTKKENSKNRKYIFRKFEIDHISNIRKNIKIYFEFSKIYTNPIFEYLKIYFIFSKIVNIFFIFLEN